MHEYAHLVDKRSCKAYSAHSISPSIAVNTPSLSEGIRPLSNVGELHWAHRTSSPVLTDTFVGDASCSPGYFIYSHNYGLVQLSSTTSTAGLIKPLNAGSFQQSGVLRAEHATFCLSSGACVHSEACPPRQLRGFDSMAWWALLSPGSDIMRPSWLNMICSSRKEAAPNSSCLKQQQTALIHWDSCYFYLFHLWRGHRCFSMMQRV